MCVCVCVCVCSLSHTHANTFATFLTCGLISVASVAHVHREFCSVKALFRLYEGSTNVSSSYRASATVTSVATVAQVDREFVEDNFNLYGLRALVPHYNEALDVSY